MVEVRIEHLNKSFGDVKAVKDVTFHIRDKEFLALLGPSGSGKTTILRCICGLEVPDSGNIYFGDLLVNNLPPQKRDVALVFQSYALYPHMTVFNNIAFPLKMHKISKNEIRKRVEQVADLLRIKHLLNRKPKEMSGGEKQRTAVGRAIVREPKVFLMDEPLSNIDAKLRVYMRAELKNLIKQVGITTIYVTHDQIEALTMADRIALLDEGTLQQLSTPTELYSRPESLFAAGFVGSPPMNLLDCSFIEKEEKALLDTANFTLDVTDLKDEMKKHMRTSEVTLGIRPEDISIQKTPTKKNKITSEIYVIEPLGKEYLITCKTGDIPIRLLAREAPGKIGEKVQLTFDMKKIHIYDRKSGIVII